MGEISNVKGYSILNLLTELGGFAISLQWPFLLATWYYTKKEVISKMVAALYARKITLPEPEIKKPEGRRKSRMLQLTRMSSMEDNLKNDGHLTGFDIKNMLVRIFMERKRFKLDCKFKMREYFYPFLVCCKKMGFRKKGRFDTEFSEAKRY